MVETGIPSTARPDREIRSFVRLFVRGRGIGIGVNCGQVVRWSSTAASKVSSGLASIGMSEISQASTMHKTVSRDLAPCMGLGLWGWHKTWGNVSIHIRRALLN